MPGSRDFGHNKLSSFSDALEVHSRRREEEHRVLNEKLGEPDFFQPNDQNDPRFGIGYWRVKSGVVSYRKYANGYDPLSRYEYTDAFISMLASLVANKPPRES